MPCIYGRDDPFFFSRRSLRRGRHSAGGQRGGPLESLAARGALRELRSGTVPIPRHPTSACLLQRPTNAPSHGENSRGRGGAAARRPATSGGARAGVDAGVGISWCQPQACTAAVVLARLYVERGDGGSLERAAERRSASRVSANRGASHGANRGASHGAPCRPRRVACDSRGCVLWRVVEKVG